MSNYSLVVNSKFRPFEFSEMLQPVMIAEQAHKELEDAYSELYSKASVWDKMTNSERDKVAHGIYSSYAQDLEQQAEELSKYGLNPSSRQQMLKMKGRYSRDIVPIEQAYKRREEQIAEQRKAGNSMIYDYDAQTTSLDKFIENPALSYKSIDRRDLYTRAMNDFGQYAKALADYGNGKRLDSFTKTFVQSYGITPEQARDFVTAMRDGNINATNPTLRAVYNALYDSTGVSRWDNAEAQQVVSNTILEGVGAAIGKSAVSSYEDKGAVMAQQLANQKSLIDYQNREAEKQRMKTYDINPTSYYSKDEVAEMTKKEKENLELWVKRGYYDKNGNLTKEGKKALEQTTALQRTSSVEMPIVPFGMGRGTKKEVIDSQFAEWVGTSDPKTLYKERKGLIDSGKLPTGAANFDVYRTTLSKQGDRDLVADRIFNIIKEEGGIHEVGPLRNGTITKGKKISPEKFAELIGRDTSKGTGSNILYLTNSPSTNEDASKGLYGQQLIELTNGKKFLLPHGIIGNNYAQDMIESALRIQNAGSRAEVAAELNRANAGYASILTSSTGTETKPNDGTYNWFIGGE